MFLNWLKKFKKKILLAGYNNHRFDDWVLSHNLLHADLDASELSIKFDDVAKMVRPVLQEFHPTKWSHVIHYRLLPNLGRIWHGKSFVHKHLVNYNSLWQIIAHRIYKPERKSLPQAAHFGHKHTVGSHWINIQLILWSATTTDPTQSSTPWRWPWTPRRRWRRATDSRRCDPSTEPTLAILVADISR